MIKKEYLELEIEVIRFQSEDVIATSCSTYTDCGSELTPMPVG